MQLRLHGQKAHEKSAPKRHGRQPRTLPVPRLPADSRPGYAGQPECAPHAVVGSSGTGGHPPPGPCAGLNRDPNAEQGGWNLYAFLGNNPQNKFDALGLKKGFIKTGDPCSKCCKECKRSQERPIIQDAGTKGINVKASVKSPNFTSEC